MDKFQIAEGVIYTVDTKGIAVVDQVDRKNHFIEYPEAAVFSVLADNSDPGKAILILQSVLDKNKNETASYISQCREKWRKLGVIR